MGIDPRKRRLQRKVGGRWVDHEACVTCNIFMIEKKKGKANLRDTSSVPAVLEVVLLLQVAGRFFFFFYYFEGRKRKNMEAVTTTSPTLTSGPPADYTHSCAHDPSVNVSAELTLGAAACSSCALHHCTALHAESVNQTIETCHILINDDPEYSFPTHQADNGIIPRRIEHFEEADTSLIMQRMDGLLRAWIARARGSPSRPTWITLQLLSTLFQILAVALMLPRELLRGRSPFASSPLPAWALGYALACLLYLLLQVHILVQNPVESRPLLGAHNQRAGQPLIVHQVDVASPDATRKEKVVDEPQIDNGLAAANSHEASSDEEHTGGLARAGKEEEKVKLRFCLDFFFGVWFVIGVIWVLGKPSTCTQASPTLYGLCVALLLVNTFGYMMPLILCCASCCCFQPTTSRVSMQDNNKKNGVSQQQIDLSLPISTIKEGIVHTDCAKKCHEAEKDVWLENIGMAGCCICLEKYEENAIVRVLPCSHYFHIACVDKWLKLNACCPLCKFCLRPKRLHPLFCPSSMA
ncbi:hypothetical protein GOP47_0010274 [Adiantum capillus-veneris]|uniref:RING-type domain-containing protein n=1 Tax=Adiantum capillus-veneris TaxID=13818 RepID=A0A9D4UVK0_ADICA|nr:hypothetical protein GOP47_0010274 [Adiantum capillus-veneris]